MRENPPVTALQEHLRVNGISLRRFGVQLGLPSRLQTLAWLIEPGTHTKELRQINLEVLESVVQATGISAGTLVEDAMRVWREKQHERATPDGRIPQWIEPRAP